MAESSGPAYAEVSITVSPAAADLVTTLLFESGATAVAVTDGAWPRLRTHLPDDSTLETHLARVKRYLASLGSQGFDLGPATLITRRFHDPGWASRWKEFFRPMRIGKRLVVRPSWESCGAKEGDSVVELDPGMAFGTGQHPTTKMCLELLEEAMEQFGVHSSVFGVRNPELSREDLKTPNSKPRTGNVGPSVLDVGTGSGLLAIAALKFGAGTVFALDTDKVACEIASENIKRNEGDRRIVVEHGSLEIVRGRTFDVVLANLTSKELIGLAPGLAWALRPRGCLITSGILKDQERVVTTRLRQWGIVLERVRRSRGWVGLMFRQPAAFSHVSS